MRSYAVLERLLDRQAADGPCKAHGSRLEPKDKDDVGGLFSVLLLALEGCESHSSETIKAEKTTIIHFTGTQPAAATRRLLLSKEWKSNFWAILVVVINAGLQHREHMTRAAAKGLSAAISIASSGDGAGLYVAGVALPDFMIAASTISILQVLQWLRQQFAQCYLRETYDQVKIYLARKTLRGESHMGCCKRRRIRIGIDGQDYGIESDGIE
ncbi:hypothetical protein S7711_10775 [Stachybotrys chartarum IBT 7711]|uniref:Uncharacterized protein n=1 Tax=Stachybotrys chartarum (strain CBS 109288 / IBT 7711) TaxID=1280523 RepID=A0A084AUD5_STACB|nr:hypothetical protein S7711_10775 [Stachybotrys chartarum IBT 7711]